MAEQSLRSPPSTPSSAPLNSTSEPSISAQIDALLESYLELLDRYATLRTTLSKELSNGFFSLAQAQRSSTLGSGRRYGEECYDERMKAGRCVSVVFECEPSSEKGAEENTEAEDVTAVPRFSIAHIEQPQQYTSPAGTTTKPFSLTTPTKETKPGSKAKNSTTSFQSSDPDPSSNTSDLALNLTSKPTSSATPRDPIRMFGILTPPILRQCQSSFITAVESPIPVLINTSNQMLAIEKEITSLRKELESEIGNAYEPIEAGGTRDRGSGDVSSGKQIEVRKQSRSKRKNKTTLASPPSEPRSRVLKID